MQMGHVSRGMENSKKESKERLKIKSTVTKVTNVSNVTTVTNVSDGSSVDLAQMRKESVN